MNSEARQGYGLVLEVALWIMSLAAAIYLFAPILSFDWPHFDRAAVAQVVRSMVIFRAGEALGLWLLLGYVFLIAGNVRQTNPRMRFIPHVATALFLAQVVLIFNKYTFDSLFNFSSWSCLPACVDGDQFCFMDSLVCMDLSGLLMFGIFRIAPYVLLMTYFVGAVRQTKKARGPSE